MLRLRIRVVDLRSGPWFVAKDVCRAIAYKVKYHGSVNTTHALRPLAANEISTHPMRGKGMSNAKIISESGLPKLIMQSDKPEARGFQDWITDAVMPAISKDGIGVAVVSY